MEQLDKNWYVVNTYASHENKVKDNILRRIETMNMQDYIFRVIVAEYEEPVKKNGVPTGKTKMKNMYPGYIFIEMYMTDEAWYVVRNTPGVTGFIGSSGKATKPFPVPKEEIETVLKRMGLADASYFNEYEVGDTIRVVNGPLADQISTITAIDKEKGLVNISTVFFGRENNVQVSMNDIEKYN